MLAALGRAEAALRILSTAEALHEEIGATLRPWVAALNGQTLTTIHAQLDAAAFASAWEQGRRLTADEAVELALESLD